MQGRVVWGLWVKLDRAQAAASSIGRRSYICAGASTLGAAV